MNKKILPPKRQDLPQTEELNAQTVNFSFAGSSKMFDQMQRENLNAVKAVAKAKKQITAAAELTAKAYQNTAVMAGGKKAVFKAAEGAEDDFFKGQKDFLKKARKGDILIAAAARKTS